MGLKDISVIVLSEMMLFHLLILLTKCFFVFSSSMYLLYSGRMFSWIPNINLPLLYLMSS
jgi:hypothetical protein